MTSGSGLVSWKRTPRSDTLQKLARQPLIEELRGGAREVIGVSSSRGLRRTLPWRAARSASGSVARGDDLSDLDGCHPGLLVRRSSGRDDRGFRRRWRCRELRLDGGPVWHLQRASSLCEARLLPGALFQRGARFAADRFGLIAEDFHGSFGSGNRPEIFSPSGQAMSGPTSGP